MTQAVNAFGTIFTFNGVEIAEVTNVGGPGLARETIEATHHQSPGMWREFIKGLKDGGEVSLDLNFMPFNTTHNASLTTGLLADFNDDTAVAPCVLTFPDADETQWSFDGIVTGFEPSEPFDDKLTASVTIKVTGQPTLA